ncbi:MAG: LysR family transcriptional regulator [Coriobacteriales bacterium]|jgi:DNA-binding transcriptional LysR family regulator|nr:LysR family transcriptional regulator [Coriobacteriales bacterium]
MDINDLREYVAFSRTMNFTKTAQELHISQSALSNHFAGMEKEMGTILVERSPGKNLFTVAGYEFLEVAAKIVNIYDGYIDKYGGNSFADSNHFVIQALQHANRATFTLLRRINEFKKLHPEVRIEIRESLASVNPGNMDSSMVDCGYYGLRLHDPAEEPGFVFVPMLEEELTVWIDKSSPLYKSESLAPKDLESFEIPTWVGSEYSGHGILCKEIYDDYGVPFKYSPRYCISREDFFLNKVYAGDAVILTAGDEAIHSISVREDRGLRNFNPPIFARMYLVFKNSDTNDAINQFRNYVLAKFEENPRSTKAFPESSI